MLRNIYYALVNSQINYGITLWGSMGSTSRLSSVFSAQKNVYGPCIESKGYVKTSLGTLKLHSIIIIF